MLEFSVFFSGYLFVCGCFLGSVSMRNVLKNLYIRFLLVGTENHP